MHIFYTPKILEQKELPQEEALHCTKVLRLKGGDTIRLTDGKGNFFNASISSISSKHCKVEIFETIFQNPLWTNNIHIALAPTKNMDRNEWFVEKATEIGINQISFLNCRYSERKDIKPDRIEKIAVAAMKQSQKSYLPELQDIITFEKFIKKDFQGQKFIAHCYPEEKIKLTQAYKKGENVLILIGPEGDFSIDEVNKATENGFIPISLGESRLRTETAALVACQTIHIVNSLK